MAKISQKRLLSLDTLRGFDMLWIIGGDLFFQSLGKNTDWVWADIMAQQVHHAKWGNFNFFDLIFPLFMFMAGASIPYALFSKLEKGVPKKELYFKIVKRTIILVIFGMIYNGALDFQFGTLRIASVLGQIGIAYFITAMIAIHFSSFKQIALWTGGILLGYAALQLLVPVPGQGSGVLTGMGSINGYIDRNFLPGRPLGKWGDPEGLLCIVSGSTVTLMGVLAGIMLRSEEIKPKSKVLKMAIIGAVMVVIALVLRPWYPIIKGLWTPTYDLLSGGLSFMLLALFYLVIDVLDYRKWTLFFRVIGMNSITIYMAYRIIDFETITIFLFGGFAGLLGDLSSTVLIAGMILLEWLLLYFLYKKEIFLKG